MSHNVLIKVYNQSLELLTARTVDSESLEFKEMLMALYTTPEMARMSAARIESRLPVHHVTRTGKGKLIKVVMGRIAHEV